MTTVTWGYQPCEVKVCALLVGGAHNLSGIIDTRSRRDTKGVVLVERSYSRVLSMILVGFEDVRSGVDELAQRGLLQRGV